MTGRWATLREGARAWRGHPRAAVVAVGALIVQQAFATWFAFSLKDVVHDITKHRPERQLTVLLVLLGVGFAVSAVAAVLGERAAARGAAAISNGLRRGLYSRLLRVSPAWLVATSPAKVATRFTNNLRSLEGGWVQAFLDTVTLTTAVAVSLPLLLSLDPVLTLLCCLALPLVVTLATRLLDRLVRANEAQSASELGVVDAVQDTVRAYEVVRTFHLEPVLSERFEQLLATHEDRIVRARTTAALAGRSASLGVLLVQVVVVVTGAELAAHRNLPVASLVGFTTVLALLAKTVYDYVRVDLPLLAEGGRGWRGIADMLDAPVVVTDAVTARPLAATRADVRFDGVRFTYPSAAEPALQSVDIAIPAGASVAVVGANGSGKSTLLRLLARLYDPQEGRILIDGVDLREVSQQSLREQLAVVLQGNYVFRDTIRENIRIGRPGASDADVEQAARLAELHDAVTALPDGYDTVIGDTGGRLSGGQRQRLAIARALLREPRMLLLDEVTTALDPITEDAINAVLERVGWGRTVVAATHRLASAATADTIVVLESGRVVEQGRHEDLLAAGGLYARLWEKQSGFSVSGDGRAATVKGRRLRHVTLFTDLDEASLDRIAAELTSEYYEADQVVFTQGDPGDRFYLVARGRVAVSVAAPSGGEHVLETLGDGDHFGELALLQDRPRTATIRTTAPSVFLTMDRSAFLDLVASTPEMNRVLEERMTRSELNLGEWRRLVGRG